MVVNIQSTVLELQNEQTIVTTHPNTREHGVTEGVIPNHLLLEGILLKASGGKACYQDPEVIIVEELPIPHPMMIPNRLNKSLFDIP